MNCKLQTRLPAAYHLLKVLRTKKGCKELLKNPGIGRKSVPLKQIKGKERLVVSRFILKGFDEWQLPKDGIYYLFLAWANWLLCQHPCTGSFSDVILIHIRTVISSFSPSPPHSSPPLTSIKLYLHSGFLPHLSHFSLLWPFPPITSHILTPCNHLLPVLFWSCCPWDPSFITVKITAIQDHLPALGVCMPAPLQGSLPFLKKGEGSRVTFRGCAIPDIKSNNHIWLFFSGIFLPAPSQRSCPLHLAGFVLHGTPCWYTHRASERKTRNFTCCL